METKYLSASEREALQEEKNRIRMEQVRNLRVKVAEKTVLNQILQYLKLKKCLCYRMNSGATVSEYKGKSRIIRFGVSGMADVLAFTKDSVMWIEAKGTGGKQSENQKSFQKEVEAFGHTYILASSVDEVMALFERGN